jgi:ribosomal protein S18 acetylase RimI-like enzyme
MAKIVSIFMLFVISSIVSNFDLQAGSSINIVVRSVQSADWQAIQDLGVRVYAHHYAITQAEPLKALRQSFAVSVGEEETLLKERSEKLVGYVALAENAVIGYVSFVKTEKPEEVYFKCFMVDPVFQNNGVGRSLLKAAGKAMPNIKKVVVLTKQTNTSACAMYKRFGGQEINSILLRSFLYKDANIQDYAGYEFCGEAISRLFMGSQQPITA